MSRAGWLTLVAVALLLLRKPLTGATTLAIEYGVDMATPRGIRNNNPGNIRHSNSPWKGKSADQPDQAFVKFDTPEYGIRAMTKLFLNYQSKYGLQTIQQLISKWAPPNENQTPAYVNAVAKAAGIGADDAVDLYARRDILQKIVTAVIKHENGQQPYANTMIAKAVQSAFA